ncbi:olfactory receptor 8-like [Ostrea edulis]|uniref:olfactory receptor 8-like n=1 Tax=Ostrea edulis TaxID=37623 RepID=UPI0024AEF076|nr:olfactory receptor 8-like [Ostrea edulis]
MEYDYADQYGEYSGNFSGHYPDYSYDYYSDYYAFKYEVKADWEIPIRGPITFCIATTTLITNFLLIFVFIFRSNRSPTTIVLTSLAVSDSLICITRLPEAIYFNMAQNYKNLYMNYSWCVTNHALFVMYSIFRMTSNWLTALLGLQRLLAVCMPFYYSRICSTSTTVIKIACIAVISVFVYLYEALGIDIKELPIYSTRFRNETLPSGCTREISKSLINVVGDIKKSMMLFYIFSGFLSRLLPVIVLLITTISLAYLLHKRITSFKSSDSYKKEQFKRVNKLVIIILIVFLVSEVQDGIAFLIYAYELATDQKNLSKEADILWDTISDTLSLISYDCNFWIFFMMSTQFRVALLDMLRCRNKGLREILNLESPKGGTSRTSSNRIKERNTSIKIINSK